jgi:valyl-tRNA synthetase
MPFMTEAVWEHVRLLRGPAVKGLDFPGDRHGELLATAGWPRVSQSLHAPDAEAEFEKLRAMATAVREVRAAQNVLPRRKIVLHVPASHAAFATSHSVLLATFCTLSQVSTGPAPAGGFGFTFEAQPFAVSDHLDAAAEAATPSGGISESERALLTKRKGELEKEVTTYEGRLANPGYALKAPPHMVKETEDKLAKAREELAAVSSRLG